MNISFYFLYNVDNFSKMLNICTCITFNFCGSFSPYIACRRWNKRGGTLRCGVAGEQTETLQVLMQLSNFFRTPLSQCPPLPSFQDILLPVTMTTPILSYFGAVVYNPTLQLSAHHPVCGYLSIF